MEGCELRFAIELDWIMSFPLILILCFTKSDGTYCAQEKKIVF